LWGLVRSAEFASGHGKWRTRVKPTVDMKRRATHLFPDHIFEKTNKMHKLKYNKTD